MPLHPIIALDHIIEEYKDHLLTEFRAKELTCAKPLNVRSNSRCSWPRNHSTRRIVHFGLASGGVIWLWMPN